LDVCEEFLTTNERPVKSGEVDEMTCHLFFVDCIVSGWHQADPRPRVEVTHQKQPATGSGRPGVDRWPVDFGWQLIVQSSSKQRDLTDAAVGSRAGDPVAVG
jgi:hypothetical protein